MSKSKKQKVSKSQQIRDLLKQGKTVEQIAKQTGATKNLIYVVMHTDKAKANHKIKLAKKAKKPSKIMMAVKEMETALDALGTKKPLTKKEDRQNAKEWHKQNKWFGVDEKKTAKALLLHEKLIQKGVSPIDNPNEYYSRIDIGMMDEKLAVKENGISFDLVKTPDPVNHPEHYKAGGIETIDFIEAKDLNYRLGNVIKYVSRAEKKENPLVDLKKAAWYLNREIATRERA